MFEEYDRYIVNEQQVFLNSLAEKYGVVAYRPSYHGAKRDGNTVLFYTKEDHAYNEKLDKEAHGFPVSNEMYMQHFWFFENTDCNGCVNPQFANHGRIDLRGLHWEEKIEEHFLDAYNSLRGKSGIKLDKDKPMEVKKKNEDSKNCYQKHPELEMRDVGLEIEIQHRDVNGQFFKHVFSTREEAYEFALSQEEDEILAVFEGPHTLYSWLMTTRSICWEELSGYFA